MTTAPSADAALPPPPPLDPSTAAVFADLDGTLAPIVATPAAVGPDARRNAVMRALYRRLGGRLAIVTGRTLGDVDRILDGAVTPVAAVHGLVRRRADGRLEPPTPVGRLPEALAALAALARADHRLFVEDKGVSAALHYRAAPEAAEACRELGARLAGALGLRLQEGDHVVELRAQGPDKGEAVRLFMAEPPFAGAVPVFLGDDLTDEAGFRAARELGGRAIIVGSRRPTAAQYALPDVEGTLGWLEGLLQRETA